MLVGGRTNADSLNLALCCAVLFHIRCWLVRSLYFVMSADPQRLIFSCCWLVAWFGLVSSLPLQNVFCFFATSWPGNCGHVSQPVSHQGWLRPPPLWVQQYFLREYVATRLNGDFGGDFFRSAHKFADYYDLCAFYTFLFALIFNTHPLSLALWPPPSTTPPQRQ